MRRVQCMYWRQDLGVFGVMDLARNALDLWYSGKDLKYDISESGYCHTKFPILTTLNLKHLCEYGETEGVARLRNLIAKKYSCCSENVLLTNGTSEGLFVLLNSILEPGDEVIVCVPYYVDVHLVTKQIPIHYIQIQIDVTKQFDIERIYNVVTDKTKCIIFNFPNNPSGVTISSAQQKEIFRFAEERKIYAISDDVFSGLYPSALPVLSGKYWISLNGMSKSFGYPGARLGWIVAHKEIIEKALYLKETINVATNIVSQRLAFSLLKKDKCILSRNNTNIRKNLSYIRETLSHQLIFQMSNYQGGCCMLLLYNSEVNAISSTALCNLIYEKTSILVAPGDCFGITNGIRIGFGMRHNKFKKIFKKFLSVCEDILR